MIRSLPKREQKFILTRDEKAYYLFHLKTLSRDGISRQQRLIICQVVADALFAQGQLSFIEGPSVVLLIPRSGNSLCWTKSHRPAGPTLHTANVSGI